MIRLTPPRRTRISTWISIVILWLSHPWPAWSQTNQTIAIRGHAQTLHVYGSPRADPVIVSSGDGGWIHLAPHVAELLGRRGFFVVGFDVRAYLESFTTARSTLRTDDEPGDYQILAEFARTRNGRKPILIGVSEGAGLSVLAATDPRTKAAIAGVVGLGLPDLNELGWRWKDALIYLTHRAPNEPTFSAASIVDRVAPAAAGGDSFDARRVRAASPTSQRILQRRDEPKRLWIVNASDHRFSDNLAEFDRRLLEAIAWVKRQRPALTDGGHARTAAPRASRSDRPRSSSSPRSKSCERELRAVTWHELTTRRLRHPAVATRRRRGPDRRSTTPS